MVALALSASTASAQTLTWGTSGTGGTSTWSTSNLNWWNGLSNVAWPSSGTTNDAVFGGTAGTVTIDTAGVSVNDITFTTTGYTLSGAGTVTLNGSAPTITLGSGISGTIGNNTATVLAGSAGLTKAGAGTLTLNGNAVHTFTGGLTLNSGTLTLDSTNLATPTNLIDSGNALTMSGATLAIVGKNAASATTSQTLAGTTLNSGASFITVNKGTSATSATLALGAITRNVGSFVQFQPNSVWTSTTASATEIVTTTGVTYNGLTYALPSSGWSYIGAAFIAGSLSNPRYVQMNSSGQFSLGPAASVWTATGGSATTVYNVGTTSGTQTGNTAMYAMIANNSSSQNLTRSLGNAINGYTLTANGILHINTGLFTIAPGTVSGTLQIGAEKELVLSAASSGGITISAPIADSGVDASSLTVNSAGSGAVTLSGINTYTGTTTVNLGTLTLGAANTLASSSGIVVNGGTLGYSTFNQSVNSVKLTGGSITATTGTLTSATDFDVQAGTISGILAGSVGLTKSTSGAVTLSGANTYSGATTINAGVLRVGNATALGVSTGAVGVASGATLDLNGTVMTGTNPLTLNGTGIAAGGALTNLSATSGTYAGLVTLGSDSSIVASSGNITLSSADTITGSGFGLTVGGGFNTTIASIIGTGAGGLTKSGTGTLTLSGVNTFTGAVTINGGSVSVAADTGLGAVPGSATPGKIVLSDGGSLAGTTSGMTISANRGMTLNAGGGALRATGANNLIYRGIITGSGGLTLSMPGSGEGQFGSANSDYSGDTDIASGSKFVIFDDSTGSASTSNLTKGVFGTGTVTVNGLNIRPTNSGAKTVGNAITLQGDLTLHAPGTGVPTGGLTFNGPVTITGGNRTLSNNTNQDFSLTVSGNIGEDVAGRGLTVSSNQSRTTVLSGSNSFTGGVTITNSGVLRLGSSNALNSAGGSENTVAFGASSTGKLQLNGISVVIANLTTNATSGTPVVENASASARTLTVGNAANLSGTFAGVVQDGSGGGTLSFTKAGNGSLMLTGSNTYTGVTMIRNGSLVLGGGDNRLATTGTVTLGDTSTSGKLVLGDGSARNQILAGLTTTGSGGSVVGGAATTGTLTISVASGTNSFGGTLGGAGTSENNLAIAKSGAGTLVLSSANPYAGATAISAGELRLVSAAAIDGTSGITVTGGRLSLDGGIATGSGKTVTVNGDGTNFFGALQGNSGTNEWQGNVIIGSTANTRIGVNSGQLTVSGTISGSTPGTGVTLRPNNGQSATLILSGQNTYSGTTTIISGTNVVRLAGGANRLPIGTAVVFGGSSVSGVLDLNGQDQEVAGISVSSGTTNEIRSATSATLTVNTTVSSSFSGVITGAAALTKTGPQTLTLTGSNTYTGGTWIKNGSITLQSGNDRLATSGTVTLGDTATTGKLVIGDTSTPRTQSLAGLTTVELGGSVVGGASTNSTLTLTIASGTNTFGGTLGGIGTNENNLAVTKLGAGTLILSNSNTYAGNTLFGTAVGTSTGVLRLASSGALGTGKLIINNGNTDTGSVELVGGVTIANNVDFFGRNSNATGAIIRNVSGNNELSGVLAGSFNGANYNFQSDSGTLTISNRITANFTGRILNLRGVGAIDISGTIEDGTGSIGVRTLDAGTYTLGGANTYTGVTTFGNGIVNVSSIANGGASSNIGASTSAAANLVFDGGTMRYTGATATSDRAFTINAGKVAVFDITSAAENLSLAGATGAATTGALTKRGDGTLTLAGVNTYTGPTRVEAGLLVLDGANAGLTGGVTIAGGTARAGTGAALGTGALALDAGGLDLNGQTVTIGTLSGSASTSVYSGMAGAARLVSNASGDSTFAGVIADVSGTVGFTKAGVGKLTFTDAQTYTGSTIISGGTLALDSGAALASLFIKAGASAGDDGVLDVTALDSGLALASGQTLGGYGTVLGDVVVANGGILAPGGSVGANTIQTLEFGKDGVFRFEFNDATGVEGGPNGWDFTTVTNGFSITADAADPFVIDIASLNSTISGSASNFDPTASYQWRFLVADAPIAGFSSNYFQVTYANVVNPNSGGFSIAVGGTSGLGGTTQSSELYIVYAAVPEPETLALAGIGLATAGLLARRRIRRRPPR